MLSQKTTRTLSKLLFRQNAAKAFRTTKPMYNQSSKTEHPNSNLYMEQMFDQYSKDPNSVHESWRTYFNESAKQSISTDVSQSQVSPHAIEGSSGVAFQAYNIIRNYQVVGHSLAKIDPLELDNFKEFGKKSLDYDYLGQTLTEEEKKKTFSVSQGAWIKDIAHFLEQKDIWSIGEIIDICKRVYSDKIGFEYYHIENAAEKHWLQKRIEELGLLPQSV